MLRAVDSGFLHRSFSHATTIVSTVTERPLNGATGCDEMRVNLRIQLTARLLTRPHGHPSVTEKVIDGLSWAGAR